MAPAWVGLNQPANRPPMVIMKRIRVSISPLKDTNFCLKVVA